MKKNILKIKLDQPEHEDGFHQEQPCCRGRLVIKSGRPRLSVSKDETTAHPDNCQKPCCRRHLVDMVGRGRKEFPIPTKEKVLQDIATMISQGKVAPLQGLPDVGGEPMSIRNRKSNLSGLMRKAVKRIKGDDKGSDKGAGGSSGSGRASARKGGRSVKANPNAQRVAAEVIRLRFFDERWKAAVAKKFNPSRGILRRARKHDVRYQGAIESLDMHFGKLRELYQGALPQAYDMLKMQYPDASDGELRAAAVQLLDQQEELAQILYVLEHYVLAFEQLDDPEYGPLKAVTATVEEAFNLFLTGDIAAAQGKTRQALADTVNFTIGNCFLPHAGEDGPATIPGASGPVGLHLILVPEDEVGIIMLMMVLYLHEFRHDVFADIKGLAEEEAMAVLKAVKEAHASGKVKLSTETITLGKTKVPLVDLIAKLFLDNLGEADADLVAIESCGWAFALNMLYVFGAFNSKKDGAIRTKELLRTSSYFQVSKKGELWFESHPVDYFRVYLLAAALELLGFKEQAQVIRDLADSAVGSKKPEFIIYEDAAGKRDPIKLRMSDLVQFAPIVAEAILMTPFAALKGKSNHDIVAWTQKRQDKTDVLVDVLVKFIKAQLNGEKVKLELPASMGDVYATYVAAAAAIAFYELICEGEVEPADVPVLVNQSSLQMLGLCLERLSEKQKLEAATPPAAPEGDGKSVAPPPAPASKEKDPPASPTGPDGSTKPLGIRYEDPAPRKRKSRRQGR